MQRKPSFVPISSRTDATRLFDEETGIVQRRLANGIPINYKVCYSSLVFLLFLIIHVLAFHYFSFLVSLNPSVMTGILSQNSVTRNC